MGRLCMEIKGGRVDTSPCCMRLCSRRMCRSQTNKIVSMKDDVKGKLKPMFSEFVLTPLWNVREAVCAGSHSNILDNGMRA